MSLFDNARKMMGQARRYADRNPDKVRQITDKAARFADKGTQGKYRRQINDAVRKVDGMVHRDRRPGH
ncbi:MAG TPA: antitoxin [Pseudonocardiaceae bacterium]|nr:antitoxin [Pseudonocardiaceae bacterium]